MILLRFVLVALAPPAGAAFGMVSSFAALHWFSMTVVGRPAPSGVLLCACSLCSVACGILAAYKADALLGRFK